MLKLPKIPYNMEKNKSQVITMRGINFSDMLTDGDIVDSKNISARAYPCITTRKPRVLDESHPTAEAITTFNGKVALVKDGKFYYDDREIGPITNGAKKFEKLNTKLIIFPDKKYFDLQDGKLKDLGAEVQSNSVEFMKDAIVVKNKAFLAAQGYGWTTEGNTFTAQEDELIVKSSDDANELQIGIRFHAKTDESRPCFEFFVMSLLGWHTADQYRGNILFSPTHVPSPNEYVVDENAYYESFLPRVGEKIYGIRQGTYSTSRVIVRELTATVTSIKITRDSSNKITQARIYFSHDKVYKEDAWDLFGVNVWLWKADCLPLLGVGATVDISKCANSEELFESRPWEGVQYYNKAIVDGIPNFTMLNIVSVSSDGKYYFDTDRDIIDYCYFGEVFLHGWKIDFTKTFYVGQNVVFDHDKNNLHNITELTPNTITFETEIDYGPGNNVCTIYSLENNGELYDFARDFKVGDTVFVSGSSMPENNTSFVISQIEQNTVFTEFEIFTEGSDSSFVTIERRIPEIDFICEHNNRLWGCSNTDGTIYASALGDPTRFFDYSGESTDSYAVAVGSEGNFTACCRYGDSVLFWKENKLHKILGSFPAEYSLYSYDVEGVQAGSERSLAVMNEVLYFKGMHGVYTFTGSVPQLISPNFGDKFFKNGVAGVDGNTYYLSMCDDGKNYLFAFETLSGIWVLEDDIRVRSFFRKNGKDLYMLTENGDVYLCGAEDGETSMDWSVQFAPFYETIEGLKSYSRIVLRLEMPKGSYMSIDIRCDSGAWRGIGRVVGRCDGIVPVTIPVNRCDKFEIRFRGHGKFKIHSMKREFYVGGER